MSNRWVEKILILTNVKSIARFVAEEILQCYDFFYALQQFSLLNMSNSSELILNENLSFIHAAFTFSLSLF